MTPRQEKIQADLAAKANELREFETMDVTTPEDEQVRSEEIKTLIASIDELQSAFDLEERAANARSKADKIKAAASTRSGLVVKAKPAAPAVPEAYMGEIRGVDSPAIADRIGRYLARMAGQELRAASTHPMGSVDTVEPDSLGETSPTYDTKGSELVQNELYRGILNQITYQSIASRLASVFQIATDGMYIPIGDDAPEPTWIDENCEIPPVLPKTSRAQLSLKKLGGRVQVSHELMEDSYINIYNFVSQVLASGFASKIDKTYFAGDAAIGFGGVVPAIAVGNTVTAAAATPTAAEWTSVLGKIDPNARNPVWVVSRTGWQDIMSLATGAIGRDITQGVQMTIYGAPVYTTDFLPAKTVAIYGDLKMATAIGVKTNGMRIFASDHRAAEFDQTLFVATQRLAFAAHSPKYLAALKTA